ncbi:hypothetical protein [Limobrevibacterium gyesilva]|uniref:Uncharacterized protein n=1 Tax=Limobrevibacterium gyesilva TaxID=2991712 RepID=A0AA42CFW5_9PROT|nr:hypothetical protein [Limobrevibacterium gyesilva]MCW3477528.1 hypothetical protein [Limobrevibacterium gyesilva]
MQSVEYVPHIDLFLRQLRIKRERLNAKSKIAIDANLLRALLQALAASMPFSEEFYLETYPDIAEAHGSGQIADLKRHFTEVGFFEGRMGAQPPVDDAYYTKVYQDVRDAIDRGAIASATDHYLRSGASEGRIPNAQLKPVVESWIAILHEDSARG